MPTYFYKGITLMDSKELANKVRELRTKEGERKTLQQVADMLEESGYTDSISDEMIRRAENPHIITGAKLHKLRVAIIQLLEKRKILGPMWVYEDEISPA